MACTNCGKQGHNKRSCPNPTKPDTEKKSRGGQPGNTNALKHGFYTKRFDEQEKEALDLLEDHLDLMSEIKTLRVVLDRALTRITGGLEVEDFTALSSVIGGLSTTIGRLVRLQRLLYGENKSLREILEGVLVEIAGDLGIE